MTNAYRIAPIPMRRNTLSLLRPTNFLVKDYLGLSAELLTALGFWAMIPWALKMPRLQVWTAAHPGGIADARFIALVDTIIEFSPRPSAHDPDAGVDGQLRPSHIKATFFAVRASFANLDLSLSQLATNDLNQVFTVTREVTDRVTGAGTVPADYTQLGWLMLTVTGLALILLIHGHRPRQAHLRRA